MATKGHPRRIKLLPRAMVREMARRMMAFGFCLFFIFGGAGFTLSHYCCDQCRAHHCGTELAQKNMIRSEKTLSGNNISFAPDQLGNSTSSTFIEKACRCCFVRHLEVDTTETAQPQAMPITNELVLFCITDLNETRTAIETNGQSNSGYYAPPLLAYTDGKKVLQRVCRWLI